MAVFDPLRKPQLSRSEDQYNWIQEAMDDAARLHQQSAQLQKRAEELHAVSKELKQRLRENRAEAHNNRLNARLKEDS